MSRFQHGSLLRDQLESFFFGLVLHHLQVRAPARVSMTP